MVINQTILAKEQVLSTRQILCHVKIFHLKPQMSFPEENIWC